MNQAPTGSEVPQDELPRAFGKYTLIRKLAEGGMAELYLAVQRSHATGFEKVVVIKCILPKMNTDQSFIDMLLSEARIAALLSHPNIVQTFDVGEVDGIYFIAMEHVRGEDVRGIVRQMRKKEHAEFPIAHAIEIISSTCAGLAYAHAKHDIDGTPLNIVHRDISPHNIVVTFEGDVKIVDFGVARSDSKILGERTESGRLKGKIPYMSPEQARGALVDWRSDIFSVGIILYELTVGRRLFKAPSEYETMRLICEHEVPKPSDLIPGYPAELERIVMRALRKDREARYQSAREMQADLENFARQERIEASGVALSRLMLELFDEELRKKRDVADSALAARIRTSYSGDSEPIKPFVSMEPPPPAFPAKRDDTKDARRLKLAGVIAGVLFVGLGIAVSSRKATPASEAKIVHANVRIETLPPGASVTVDGTTRTELTPTVLDVAVGREYTIRVVKKGYLPADRRVVPESGKGESVTVTLEPALFRAELKINAPSPTIVVDNVPVPDSHLSALAADLDHEVVVSAPGYEPAKVRVSGNAGESKQVDVKLEKLSQRPIRPIPTSTASVAQATRRSGKLNVDATPGWCNVSIDGQPHGATPVAGVELPAGPHQVVCSPQDGAKQSANVVVQEDSVARFKFTLP